VYIYIHIRKREKRTSAGEKSELSHVSLVYIVGLRYSDIFSSRISRPPNAAKNSEKSSKRGPDPGGILGGSIGSKEHMLSGAGYSGDSAPP